MLVCCKLYSIANITGILVAHYHWWNAHTHAAHCLGYYKHDCDSMQFIYFLELNRFKTSSRIEIHSFTMKFIWISISLRFNVSYNNIVVLDEATTTSTGGLVLDYEEDTTVRGLVVAYVGLTWLFIKTWRLSMMPQVTIPRTTSCCVEIPLSNIYSCAASPTNFITPVCVPPVIIQAPDTIQRMKTSSAASLSGKSWALVPLCADRSFASNQSQVLDALNVDRERNARRSRFCMYLVAVKNTDWSTRFVIENI